MKQARVFLFSSLREAEILRDLLTRSQLAADLLDPAQLLDKEGQPLFDGRRAGVACYALSQSEQTRTNDLLGEEGLDFLELDREAILEDALEGSPWPSCPSCDRRRLAVCPICKTSGTDFPRADPNYAAWVGETDSSASRLAVICNTCDEPWQPEFLRLCEWCGHDFGDGAQIELAASSAERPPTPPRVIISAVVLATVLLAIAAYFLVLTG